MDYALLTLVIVLSSWLAYMNWKARIKLGDKLMELNPVWAVFDKLGFKRIQFVIIPFVFVGVFLVNVYFGTPFGGGMIVGILFLNTMVDAMTLNRYKMFEGTNAKQVGKKSNSVKKGYRHAFLLSWAQLALILLVVTFLLLFVESFILIISSSIFLGLGYFATIGGMFLLIFKITGLGFERLSKIKNLFLFKYNFYLPNDDGIPRRPRTGDR